MSAQEEEVPAGYATRVSMIFQADEDMIAEVTGLVVTFGSGAMALAAVLGGDGSGEDPITETLAAFMSEPENAPVLSRKDGAVVLSLFAEDGRSVNITEGHGDYLVSVSITDVREASAEEAALLDEAPDEEDTAD